MIVKVFSDIISLILFSIVCQTFAQISREDHLFGQMVSESFDKAFTPNIKGMNIYGGNASLYDENKIPNHLLHTFTEAPKRKKPHKKHQHHGKSIEEEGLPPDLIGEPLKVRARQVKKSQELVGNHSGFKDDAVTMEYIDYDDITSEASPTTTPAISTTPKPVEIPHFLPLIPINASNLFGFCNIPTERYVCFGYPEGCINERACRMAVALSPAPPEYPSWIKVTMAATAPRGFVALGFSGDRFMGDDTVVHCNNFPKSKRMTLHLSLNEDYHSVVQHNKTNFFRNFKPLAGYAQDNGVIGCEFLMSTKIHPDSLDRNISLLSETNHLFLAFGRHSEITDANHSDFGALRFHHMTAVSEEQENSPQLSSLLANGQMLEPRSRILILTHIIPYTLAFSFFIPCAMFIAKYGREAYCHEKENYFQMELWLRIHAAFQSIAVFLSIVGLVGIVQELGGEWRSSHAGSIFHSLIGILATVFLWVNFLFGWMGFSLRKKNDDTGTEKDDTGTEKTKFNYHYFKWGHWFLGNSVYWLGMGALVVAHEMRRATIPCIFMYIVLLQIIVHCGTHTFMTFHTSWLVKILDGKHWQRRVYPGPMIPWVKADIPSKFPTPETKLEELGIWCGRRRAVIFYFITCFFCCVGLIGLVLFPIVLCRQTYETEEKE